MDLNKRLFRLDIENNKSQPPPLNFTMVTTPPDEDEDDELSPLKLREESSKPSQIDLAKRVDPVANVQPFDAALSRIYRHTPTPTVVLDASLQVVEVSDSHLSFAGLSRDVALESFICDICPRVIPALDIATLYGALRAAITSRDIQHVDNIHLPDPNSYYSLRITPIYEKSTLLYMTLEAHSITKKFSNPTNNHHSYVNDTYKVLLDTVKDYAIFMLDTRGNIVTWNSGAAILKGYSARDIIGKHFSTFYGEEDRLADKPGKELVVCLREGKVEDEGWRYRKDGSRFWANVLITPMYEFGRHIGFTKVTRDLTERNAAEARMIAAFEESAKLKTDFLANMSHEIRTPMNGMLLALTTLMEAGLTERQREYASIIEDSTSLLLQVINDVLDYSKLSSGSFSLHPDAFSVDNVTGAVVRNCKSTLKPDVELVSYIAPGFPLQVEGDPLRYRQVLQNLVGNAVKFTDKGYVKIQTSFAEDMADPTLLNITTEVFDTGVGVPEDAHSSLFTPFTRFADSSTRRYQGTGLGLSICKSLAELMDGSVGFRPNPEGRGSVFWMTTKMRRVDIKVPLRTLSPGSLVENDEDIEAKIHALAPHKYVLLVEDNLVNQMVMLKLLKNMGFARVDAAWDGAEAVRLVKQQPFAYNLILMDINMPILDGVEATQQIRQMGLDVPIIALTGNALKGDAEMYMAKGMSDYIGKPIHRKQLTRLIWKWIGT
ncbi:sensor histidine kinase/response regulator Fos-1/TcsA [Aspergillus homomorphus CBS 101889]|uniref:Histidine kinase n=1 Tax=Aspergillus homomorphus (strain CBS 101889) TaxID=1450537 RepID=A0A395I025_ASPHC|nr:histidine kinase [Aspergillus homomorphus CBS 101889]RAL12983.1 histidine kinase [Aspergillus homomorphus CBS 101889]